MLLEEMNWMGVGEYLKREDRILLVTGACEQHGYLSLLADVRIPAEIARRAGERARVLVAPPLPFGVSPHFAAYPGTISLTVETYMRVVRELVEGLHAQGFRRMLIVNGHGGNRIGEILTELANRHPALRLDWLSWWMLPEVLQVAARHDLVPDHANWLENFRFTRVGDVPEGRKERVSVRSGASAVEIRAILGDGSYGGPYAAPDEVMEEILEAAVAVATARLAAL